MKVAATSILVFIAIPGLLNFSAFAAPAITSFGTPGNLSPTYDLDCVTLEQVKNTYTPADLMLAQSRCYKLGKLEDAARLFMIAGAYAHFDTKRVVDATSHDAFQVLTNNYRPDPELLEKFRPIFGRYKDAMSPDSLALCVAAKKLGPPNYYPAYMIQHGMAAFLGSTAKNGLASDFDATSAWKQTLGEYLYCDVSGM